MRGLTACVTLGAGFAIVGLVYAPPPPDKGGGGGENWGARISFRDRGTDKITSDFLEYGWQCDGATYWSWADAECAEQNPPEASARVHAAIHPKQGTTNFATVTGAPKDVCAVRFFVFNWSERTDDPDGPDPDVYGRLYANNVECERTPCFVESGFPCVEFLDNDDPSAPIDHVAAGFYAKFLFKSSTTRVPLAFGLRTVNPRGPWGAAGSLTFVDDLYVIGPPDVPDDVRIVTTEDPDGVADADLADLTVRDEYLGTYRMPFEMTVRRVIAP
ncbi:MAG: hypothetical protein ACYSW2_17710 [Planctomycetota bacterium]|jgi:hypothetical protein